MAAGEVELQYPLGGLWRRGALQSQPPFTTPGCQNVRPRDVFQQRERGGQRPGISRAYAETLGDDTTVAGTAVGTPTYTSSSNSSAIVASTAIFTAAMIGATIKFASNRTYTITAFTDTTHVVVAGNASVEGSAQTFTIYLGDRIACLATVRAIGSATPGAGLFADEFEGAADPLTGWSACAWGDETLRHYNHLADTGETDVWAASNPDDDATTEYQSAMVHTAPTDLNAAQPYTLALRASPETLVVNATTQTSWGGKIRLFGGLAATSPNWTVNGFRVQVDPYTDNNNYVVVLSRVVASVTTTTTINVPRSLPYRPFTLSVVVDGGSLSLYLDFALIGTQTFTPVGHGFGIGMQQRNFLSDAGEFFHPLIDNVALRYSLPMNDSAGAGVEQLVAVSGGRLYYETNHGTMRRYDFNQRKFSIPPPVDAVERGGKLFFADWAMPAAAGTNGVLVSGSFTDPSVSNWVATGAQPGDVLQVTGVGSGSTVVGQYEIAGVNAGSIYLLTASANGSGLTYRIMRAPKVWDPAPSDNTTWLNVWRATAGKIPLGCPLIMLFQDCVFLGGAADAPHEYFASRQGNPFDWDFSVAATDLGRAFAGTDTPAAVVGGAMTAMFSHQADYAVFSTASTTLALRGHPLHGGAAFETLSNTLGIVDQRAWCAGPTGETYILTRDGVYVIPPGAAGTLQPVSRETLPGEMVGMRFGAGGRRVCMTYDVPNREIHVFLSPDQSGGASHWALNLQTPGWWPDSVPTALDPFSVVSHDIHSNGDRLLLMGCRDGRIRNFQPDYWSDDGTAISSYVIIGPVRLGASHSLRGILARLDGVLGPESNSVRWKVFVADEAGPATAAAVSGASPFASGTWSHGLNFSERPRAGGAFMCLRLESYDGSPWAVERVTAVIESLGLIRRAS